MPRLRRRRFEPENEYSKQDMNQVQIHPQSTTSRFLSIVKTRISVIKTGIRIELNGISMPSVNRDALSRLAPRLDS